MKNNYDENKDTTGQHFEELTSMVEKCEDQMTDAIAFDKCTDIDNNTECQKSSSCLTSILNSPQRSSLNSIEQSYNDSHKIAFNSEEWLMEDSISRKRRAPRQNEFLYLLLENSRYSSYASWLNKDQGVFKIHEPERVATLWTKVKNRRTNGLMDYETFARGIRYYYKSGSMIKTHTKSTFRFNMSNNNKSE